MQRFRRLPVLFAAGAGLIAGGSFFPSSATAAPNPIVDPANGHATMANGKAISHVSSGTEVSFADERALGGDVSPTGSDTPPDATATALGCANRGTARNPRVNQDCTLRRQAEEQVAVNPRDPTNVVAGQNDSRIGFNKCGFDYSLNGGTTWGDGLPPFYQHLSPVGHTYDAGSDPALTFDGTGRSWFSCVLFDINSNASGLAVVPSTVNLKGSAYSNLVAGRSPFVVIEDASGKNFFDKEFIAGDHRLGNTSVYVTFTDFQASPICKRSTNKSGQCQSPIFISKWTGTAWTTPVEISGGSSMCTGGSAFNPQIPDNACNMDQGSFPVVLPDGNVYVAFSNFNTPSAVNQQLGVLVHVNGNTLTADAPVKIGTDDESKAALCDFGRGPEQCVQSLFIRSDDFPALALDPTDPAHLVTTWTDTRTGSTGQYDVIVSESHDGGATWTENSPLTTSGAYFEPSVTVSSTGKVVVSEYRANTALQTTLKGDGTFGYGYEVNAGTYTNASDGQAYPSPYANTTQRGFLGDYSSIAAGAGGSVYMVWSDTRNRSSRGPDEDVFLFKTTV